MSTKNSPQIEETKQGEIFSQQEIIKAAAEGYGDLMLVDLITEDGKLTRRANQNKHGDTLATWVARAVLEFTAREGNTPEDLYELRVEIRKGIDELEGVESALLAMESKRSKPQAPQAPWQEELSKFLTLTMEGDVLTGAKLTRDGKVLEMDADNARGVILAGWFFGECTCKPVLYLAEKQYGVEEDRKCAEHTKKDQNPD